jgi:hypothetical protein
MILMFGLPIMASGQNHYNKVNTINCHVKDLLCNNILLFRMFNISNISTDHEQIETYFQKQIENNKSAADMTFTSYRLHNNSVIDIGIADSTLVVSMIDSSFCLFFVKKVNINFIGYMIYPSSVKLFFYLNDGGCNLYFSHTYSMEFKQQSITEYDYGPSK